MQHHRVQEDLVKLRNKHWSSNRKQVMASVYGAIIYQIWTARNHKIFRGQTLHNSFVIHQLQIIIRLRLEMYRKLGILRVVGNMLILLIPFVLSSLEVLGNLPRRGPNL